MNTTIEIWQPKYKDRTVLIAKYKVVHGDNYIKFTKAKHLEGHLYKMSGEDIAKHPIVDNGKLACYSVPLDKLERIE